LEPGGLELAAPPPRVFVGRVGGESPAVESSLRLLARNDGFTDPPTLIFADEQRVPLEAVLRQLTLQAYPHFPTWVRSGMPGPYPAGRLLLGPGAEADLHGYVPVDSLNGFVLYRRSSPEASERS